jgi:Putative mono-oxygenase ydhR
LTQAASRPCNRCAPWLGLAARRDDGMMRQTKAPALRRLAVMITAIVQYRLPPSIDLAACAEHFRKIAPGFRAVPGLIRKQFIYAEDGWAGGVYLWKTRADAEAFYSGPWLAGIRERYGMDPQIKYFETACVTDNSVEAVLLPDAAE